VVALDDPLPSFSGSYVMRLRWWSVSWFVACASSLIGNGHASAHRPQVTQVSSRMKRAPVRGSTWSASTGQT